MKVVDHERYRRLLPLSLTGLVKNQEFMRRRGCDRRDDSVCATILNRSGKHHFVGVTNLIEVEMIESAAAECLDRSP